MSLLPLLLTLAIGTETMGPAPTVTEIEDHTRTEIVATVTDIRYDDSALNEMRVLNARIDRLAKAAESEVVAAAYCHSGAGCQARLQSAVERLQCVDTARVRASSALESSERALGALRQAVAEGSPELAVITRTEEAKVSVALNRVRQSAVEVSACVGESSSSITVSYN